MDGCTDKTSHIVLNYSKNNSQLHPFILSKKLGKGGALIEAFKKSQGNILLFIDADGSINPHELNKFLKEIKTSNIVIGCRYFKGSKFTNNLPLNRLILSRTFNAIVQITFNIKHIPDTQCGVKAIQKETLKKIDKELFVTDYAFDLNLIYCATQKGYSIKQVFVNYEHIKNYSKVSGKLFTTTLQMGLSIMRLRIYYSQFGKLLNNQRIENILQNTRKILKY